jgi:hypothetical protein
MFTDDELDFRPRPGMRTPRELIFHTYCDERVLAEAAHLAGSRSRGEIKFRSQAGGAAEQGEGDALFSRQMRHWIPEERAMWLAQQLIDFFAEPGTAPRPRGRLVSHR